MEFKKKLYECKCCPHECGVNRLINSTGYCHSDASFNIGSICIHQGEEPVISGKKGICNVFFTHCNIQCIYCQNYQISRNDENTGKELSLENIVSVISDIFNKGINHLGFVSPSHCIPQMEAIIKALHKIGKKPVIVYNSNAYDKVETLRTLESLIDVYLPDFKYADNKISAEYSDVFDYPETALKAIKEMVRQKGTSLRLDENGQAECGVIVRHLVLPGNIDNSKNVLRLIADEISTSLHLSLMSQYYPTTAVMEHPQIGRYITEKEYSEVVEEMERLGFYRGWVQEYSSNKYYRPDFFKEKPFE